MLENRSREKGEKKAKARKRKKIVKKRERVGGPAIFSLISLKKRRKKRYVFIPARFSTFRFHFPGVPEPSSTICFIASKLGGW